MLFAIHSFYFNLNYNFAVNNVFLSRNEENLQMYPPISGNFLLMDGTQFLLLDGSNFLLLG